MNKDRLGHAVVIGGSMAGLLAARVLGDHFGQVTVIAGPEGVQVTRLGHPRADVRAVPLELPTDIAWLTPASRWTQTFPATQRVVSATRSLLEWTVRSRVEKVAGIDFRTEQEVTGLHLGPTGDVSGLTLRSRSTGTTTDLYADLVVDAGGRGSKLPEWLGALGFAAPEESTVDSFLGYATRLLEIPAGFSARWKAVYIQNAPPVQPRGGIMFPIEGDRWVLTLIGGGRDYPPTDDEGFGEFAASLRSPLLSDLLAVAEPVSPIWGYRRTANRWRHYEKLAMPGRLLAIGDSLCAFNPAYGQGMTVAAKEAEVLAGILAGCRSTADLPRALRGAQRAIAARAKGPWMLATGSDLRYPTTVGASQTPVDRLVSKYLDRVLAKVSDDPVVSAAFLRVLNMIDDPQALFSPRLMPRVLFGRPRSAPVLNDFTVPVPVE
jgi:2-polyprenyl-6-methoxyphenol hydroxylase-like FAD-dependent oxidoreductase